MSVIMPGADDQFTAPFLIVNNGISENTFHIVGRNIGRAFAICLSRAGELVCVQLR